MVEDAVTEGSPAMEGSNGNKLVKILTIDGGGIRGLIPAVFVREIEHRCQRPAHELFDVIAGTSTGSLVRDVGHQTADQCLVSRVHHVLLRSPSSRSVSRPRYCDAA